MDKVVQYGRREDMRIPYRGTVRFSADQFNWYLNQAKNISKRGIFIDTEEMFRVGTRLYLTFDLTIGSEVVRRIRTTGRVVRLAKEGESAQGVGSGIGIQFSLLPGERQVINAFTRDNPQNQIADFIDARQSPAMHVCMKVEDSTSSPLGWWFKELVNRVYSTNGIILELFMILIFIILGVVLFL